jgi:hypothetical protein
MFSPFVYSDDCSISVLIQNSEINCFSARGFPWFAYKFQLAFIYHTYFYLIRDNHYSPSAKFRNNNGSVDRKDENKRYANRLPKEVSRHFLQSDL